MYKALNRRAHKSMPNKNKVILMLHFNLQLHFKYFFFPLFFLQQKRKKKTQMRMKIYITCTTSYEHPIS